MAKAITTATVLAFEKKLVPSDGFMYGTTWEKRHTDCTPLKLQEKSVRGTISNRQPDTIAGDPLKLNKEIRKPNLQRVDSCALGVDQDTLKLQFTLKVLSGIANPSACNSPEFKQTYAAAVQQYITDFGFKELAKRYATNLANARFLWRNRVGAENIEVQIKKLNQGAEKTWTFTATKMKLREFNTSPELAELSQEIADALAGKQDFLLLEINAYAQVGLAQDVYPSEELVLDKSNAKDKKSKILYDINGIAGMHSQKIGNAIRTIDTWYPEYDTADIGPIAIEPYGAVTNLGKAYRNPKNKSDFFTLFDKWATGGSLERIEDQHYVAAVLVRGGVFGESGKE